MYANSELLSIYNIIKDISGSIFSNFASSVSSSLTTFNLNFNSVIDRLGIKDTWSDNVSTLINSSIKSGLSAMVEGCKEPSCSVINKLATVIDNLISTLALYLAKIEEYNTLLEEKNVLSKNEPNKTYYDSKRKVSEENPEWSLWNRKMTAYTNLLKELEIIIEGLEGSCLSLVAIVKGLLTPVGSDTSNVALSSQANLSHSISTSYVDGNKKVMIEITSSGKVVGGNYTIYDTSGNSIGYGSVFYDDAGQKSIEEYFITQSDGNVKMGVIDYSSGSANESYSILDGEFNVISSSGDLSLFDKVSKNDVVSVDEIFSENIDYSSDTTVTDPNFIGPIQKLDDSSSIPSNNKTTRTSYTPEELAFIGDVDNDQYTVSSNAGSKAQELRFFYNGKELSNGDEIVIKKGETARIIVKLPTTAGKINLLERTSAAGAGTWKDYASGHSEPFVDRYDASTFLHTNNYDWVITGENVGSTIISQTAYMSTDSFSGIKSMGTLKLKVVS